MNEGSEENALARALEHYLQSLDSIYSRRSARTAITQWIEWSADAEEDVAATRWTHLEGDSGVRNLRGYARELNYLVGASELEANSARSYYDRISAYLTWAVRDGYLSQNPALKDRAREELPTDHKERRQQHWDPETRDRFLQFVEDRTYEAIEEKGHGALAEARDRAFVYLLAYSGVRGAEVVRASGDDREGRKGLRWRRVDLDAGTLTVYGKGRRSDPSERWQETPLPKQARSAVRRYRKIQDPPSEDWPVFPTEHAPSKYATARDGLAHTRAYDDYDSAPEDDRKEIDALLEDQDIDDVLHEHELVPPAITVAGMRSRVRSLCKEVGIDIDGKYLKLHAARRGIGDTVFRKDRGAAQDLLRHRSQQTTREAYSYISAQEQSEHISGLLDGTEES